MDFEDVVATAIREHVEVEPPPMDAARLTSMGRRRRRLRNVAVVAAAAIVVVGGSGVLAAFDRLPGSTGPTSTFEHNDGFKKACGYLRSAQAAYAANDPGAGNDQLVKADSWAGTAMEDADSDAERAAVVGFADAVRDAVQYPGGERAQEDIQRAADACGL